MQSIYLAKKQGIRATKIAGSFGVNEKTVRDIWSGQTWAKETLHLSHGDSKRSGSLSRVIERKRPKGRIHTTQLATDRQALRPSPNHNCIENTGRCNDGLEHFSDARITHFESVDEQFWKWDEAIECNLCSTDPFKLDWKP